MTPARDEYLSTDVLTASPQKLQLMLIDAAIRAGDIDTAWINGYVPQLDDRLNHELGSSFLPAVFILSPDGKLIARDVPVNEAGRILSQFLEGPRQPSTNPLPQ